MDVRARLRPLLGPVARVVRPIARDLWRKARGIPPVGRVNFGDLRRTKPVSNCWGMDRGNPVDRVYIERFLDANRGDIRGRVLEVGGRWYATQFGGAAVTHLDMLDKEPSTPGVDIVADLTRADHLPGEVYDTVLVTQVLQLIYDVPAALATVHRLLKPGGVLLVTVAGISGRCKDEGDVPFWCWSFSGHSLEKLLGACFAPASVQTREYGNVLAAVAFLEGLAASELSPEEMDVQDADYPIVISARAVKGHGVG